MDILFFATVQNILQYYLNCDYLTKNVNVISQWTVMLRGLDIMLGGDCGPSGPRFNSASHLNCTLMYFLFRTVLMVDDTLTGVLIKLMLQFVLFSGTQPLTCIDPDG